VDHTKGGRGCAALRKEARLNDCQRQRTVHPRRIPQGARPPGGGNAGLDLSLSAESWTIRQILHHVVDGDDLWKVVIKAALGEPGRVHSLQWYWDTPQTAWSETWAYAARRPEPSLELLRASRRHVVQLLTVIPGSLARQVTMRWPSGEEVRMVVGDIVLMQSDHVAHHVRDIDAIRNEHGL
jgi:hypothetical protein